VFTNSMVGALLASALLLIATVVVNRRAALVPGRFQALVEFPVEWVANIVRGTGGKRWREFAGLVIAIFMFVLVANYIGLLPGVGVVGYEHETEHGDVILVPFVRAAAADLNFTLGLALIAFVAFIFWGIRANGIGGYLKELLIAEPWYMTPILTPIHIISELSRLISLSLRLYGNIFGGEVLLTVMIALIPVVIPVGFLLFEVLVGFVQALVFALLTMTYIVLAIAEHRQHEAAEGHAEEPTHSEAEPAAGSA
jgi:F-type H+-transporting ATPase subunit a